MRIPADHRIGAEGDGWRLAAVTLGNERVSLSEGGVLWGMGPETVGAVRRGPQAGGIADPRAPPAGRRVHTEAVVLDLLGRRMVTAVLHGRDPGPEARSARPSPTGTGRRPWP